MISSPRWRSAAIGATSDVRSAGFGVFGTSVMVAMSAMNISTLTP
jgi:hypothetical protein